MLISILSILTAVSSLTVVYPKVVLTVVFIPTVVYFLTVVSSLSDYSPQHSPYSYFHVILISAYPAVRVKFYQYYAWQKTNLLFAGKESSLQTCNYAKGRNQCRNNANDSFGKGFHLLRSRAKPFNDWALPAYITAITAEVPLAFSPK